MSQVHAGQQVVTSNAVTPSKAAAEILRKPKMLEAKGRRPRWGGWWCPGGAARGPTVGTWLTLHTLLEGAGPPLSVSVGACQLHMTERTVDGKE